MMNNLHLFLNFFIEKRKRIVYSSSNFHMSDFDEYEQDNDSLWDDDEVFSIADQTDEK